ncbi:MAG TPA: capsule assembly Wzi family protein [Bacteroidales bacterium]|nr:capsule assembly Wzi family protein [Bacteroidales bacterium]
MKKTIVLLLFIFCSFFQLHSQEIYQNISNSNIYEFIDELANDQIISVNSVIKPYSRKFIAEKLNEAYVKKDLLSKRQQQELDFYLLDFGKELPGFETTDHIFKIISKNKSPLKKRIDLFYYKDSLFTITLNPIIAFTFMTNENGSYRYIRNGAEANATIGKNWGFYASLRDNHESELLAKSSYITQQTGGCYKPNKKGGGDYEEMKGGITYSWNWGSVGLIKDHISWGNNYNGANIISNRPPSFPMLSLHIKPVKWFDFNYIHGWLVSGVIDSLKTYSFGHGNRIIYHPKYIAANMFTFTPFKNLNFSLGNSVIYSDIGIQPGFLIPVMFFKAIDHGQNGMSNYAGQNAQMFFDISSRQIKHVHLYSSLFLDEINTVNMFKEDKHSNFFSFKIGTAISNIYLKNVTLITEYTRTNPIVYKHFIPTTTFETNGYNIGNYLRDNTDELFFAIKYKPIRKLKIELSYLTARKGNDYKYSGGIAVLGLPFMNEVIWSKKNISCNINYEIFNDINIFVGYSNSLIKDNLKNYTPEFYLGNTNTLSFGMNWGF